MEALQLFVSRQKDIKKKEEKILELYTAYVGDPVFYHTAAMDDVMDSFTQWPVEERLYRMEMLAELALGTCHADVPVHRQTQPHLLHRTAVKNQANPRSYGQKCV